MRFPSAFGRKRPRGPTGSGGGQPGGRPLGHTTISPGTARAPPLRGVSGAVQLQRADLLEVLAEKSHGAAAAKLRERAAVFEADEMVMQVGGCQRSTGLTRGLRSELASAFEPAAAAERGVGRAGSVPTGSVAIWPARLPNELDPGPVRRLDGLGRRVASEANLGLRWFVLVRSLWASFGVALFPNPLCGIGSLFRLRALAC